MNKKGFTLIEVLLAITIIAVASASSIILLVNTMDKSKQSELNYLKQQIIDAAEVYLSLEESSTVYLYQVNGRKISIRLSDLQSKNLIGSDFIHPLTGEEINSDNVIITFTNNSDNIVTSITGL